MHLGMREESRREIEMKREEEYWHVGTQGRGELQEDVNKEHHFEVGAILWHPVEPGESDPITWRTILFSVVSLVLWYTCVSRFAKNFPPQGPPAVIHYRHWINKGRPIHDFFNFAYFIKNKRKSWNLFKCVILIIIKQKFK